MHRDMWERMQVLTIGDSRHSHSHDTRNGGVGLETPGAASQSGNNSACCVRSEHVRNCTVSKLPRCKGGGVIDWRTNEHSMACFLNPAMLRDEAKDGLTQLNVGFHRLARCRLTLCQHERRVWPR